MFGNRPTVYIIPTLRALLKALRAHAKTNLNVRPSAEKGAITSRQTKISLTMSGQNKLQVRHLADSLQDTSRLRAQR